MSLNTTVSSSDYDLREIIGEFTFSGTEQDGVIARSGWDNGTNATTGLPCYQWNTAFKVYLEEDLNHTIQPIEGVIAVNQVLMEPPDPWEMDTGTGMTYVHFQLDRDVWKDSPTSVCDGHITDWGLSILQPIRDLLVTKWYVNSSSIDVGYAIPDCADSASGFTLTLTVVSFSLVLLLFRRRRQYM